VLDFLAAVAAKLPGACEVPDLGWLLPIEATKHVVFDPSTDALGLPDPRPVPAGEHGAGATWASAKVPAAQDAEDGMTADAAGAHAQDEQLSGPERRAHAVWLASTLSGRAAGGGHAVAAAAGDVSLSCARGVLTAVLARRQRSLNHGRNAAPSARDCSSTSCAQAASVGTETDVKSAAPCLHDDRQALSCAKPLWRGRRKRNKKQAQGAAGDANFPVKAADRAAGRAAHRLRDADAGCQLDGDAAAERQVGEGKGPGPERSPATTGEVPPTDDRGAEWYHSRRPKKHRLLAQVSCASARAAGAGEEGVGSRGGGKRGETKRRLELSMLLAAAHDTSDLVPDIPDFGSARTHKICSVRKRMFVDIPVRARAHLKHTHTRSRRRTDPAETRLARYTTDT
jgi:hypothetical protein